MFLRNKETLIKGFIIIISALIAAYILNDIINGIELRKISKINLIKIKSKINENEEKKEKINEIKNNLNENKLLLNKKEEKPIKNKQENIIQNYGPQIIELSKIWRVQQYNASIKDNLSLCPEKPPNLKGKINVDMSSPRLEEIEAKYKDIMPGGHWRPKECKARNKVAIVVPYRDRMNSLRSFLHHMHPFLQKQQLDYAIFIVEQIGNFTFNKGKLTNIGIMEALRVYPFDCIIVHDVDTFPENDNNLYTCSSDPNVAKHLSVFTQKNEYSDLYPEYIGSVIALTVDQFKKINGWSNDFWGWGGEDDDLSTRAKLANITFWRPEGDIPRYRSFEHKADEGNKPNDCRFEQLGHTESNYLTDGFKLLADVLIEEFYKWKNYTSNILDCD
ncbi:hypothetical protein Mgra_00008670 [Meloidogyne graminicola]|uniref:Beta-1,4-N-acetylgalactosaminyltransferase n=1 Tax=Meloidogyne graminicola TaxID=189291 RepID=A0A8S9ZF47_9BILA|nr:hypothetical protein Mgra_00008670 [Meloidogyne graminicola]